MHFCYIYDITNKVKCQQMYSVGNVKSSLVLIKTERKIIMNIKTKKARKWQITINNPKIDFDNIKNMLESKYKNIIYYCYSKEVGKQTHTVHYHIFMYTKSPISGSSLLNLFEGAHLEVAKGTCQENRNYIYKVGKWENTEKEDTRIEGMQFENCECPVEKPGKRNDLEELKGLILQGKTNGEIYEANASFLRFANSIDKMRLDLLTDKFGKEWRDVEVTYIEGATGSGKTRGIMDEYGYANVYRVSKDDYSFSTYTTQPVCVFEEFRNTFQLTDMLNLLDGYPVQGRAMHGFRQLGYNKVFICSNWKLDEQYQHIQKEHPQDWQAFLRRINKIIIREYDKDTVFYQKNRGTKENPQYDFISDEGISYFDPFDLYEWGDTGDLELYVLDEDVVWEDIPEMLPRKKKRNTDEEDYNAYMEEEYEKSIK